MNENPTRQLLRFYWAFTERFPKCVDEYETLLNGKPYLETAYR